MKKPITSRTTATPPTMNRRFQLTGGACLGAAACGSLTLEAWQA